MKKKFALFISVIGHPLLTIPIFVSVIMFATGDLKKASIVSSVIVGCIFLPLTIWMFLKSRHGSYTNFDVSDRVQRKSLYLFIVPLLIIAIVVLHATEQSKQVLLSLAFALVIILVSQGVNFFIKSSLHVSMNIYLSFIILPLNLFAGVILLILTALIGWSRIVLGRHTLNEVISGTIIGLIISTVMLIYLERL